jgi:hypothetical protein
VPNSDTLHVLIRDYRESRKILLNIEHRIMLQMAPDYDNLTLMQKVEVFGYALDNTTGQDLYRVLWLKSKSSEAWLERRTNYTRSLAVMSMVGYILGLGDRHPSNLMLDRNTGKIIHIDFGDCFEVAMHREKYPERVPFRLTRMLTFAMEVSNIEGSFRTTCEHTMRVLRENKESLIAVLEAFIHDPLLTWRLGNKNSPPEPSFPSERRVSIIGDLDSAPRSTPGGRKRAPPGADNVPEPCKSSLVSRRSLLEETSRRMSSWLLRNRSRSCCPKQQTWRICVSITVVGAVSGSLGRRVRWLWCDGVCFDIGMLRCLLLKGKGGCELFCMHSGGVCGWFFFFAELSGL